MPDSIDKDALIGATGFVGGHVGRQHRFPARFNSRTIADARGVTYDTVVCAAAPGSMFEANRFPEKDRQSIRTLMADLAGIHAGTFVLVSTIAVFEGFCADGEDADNFATELAYGRHRHELEVFCADHFPSCLVVRLPALFGSGLKKNFLFDIRNPMPTMLPAARFEEMSAKLPASLRNGLPQLYRRSEALGMFVIDRDALEASGRRADYDQAVREAGFAAEAFTAPQSRFQFYDMSRIWRDISLSLAAGLKVVHLAPPPLPASAVYRELTGRPMPPNGARVHQEDMRTRHAGLWGAQKPYIASEADVLEGLRRFNAAEREAA